MEGTIQITAPTTTQDELSSAAKEALADIFGVAQEQVEVTLTASSARRLSTEIGWQVSYIIQATAQQAAAINFDSAVYSTAFEGKLGDMGVQAQVTSFADPVIAAATTTASAVNSGPAGFESMSEASSKAAVCVATSAAVAVVATMGH